MQLHGQLYVPVRIGAYCTPMGFECVCTGEPHLQPNVRFTGLGYLPVFVGAANNPFVPDWIKGGTTTPPVEALGLSMSMPLSRMLWHN